MVLKLHKILLILLGLLQLVAPLVHAHSSHQFSQFGVHLPTLEIYSTPHYQRFPTLQAADYSVNVDDAIVSISTGIKNQPLSVDNLSPLLYFPPHPTTISLVLDSCKINFSPQRLQPTKTFVHSPQSPRAPPF
jgi:hypothetical protein